VAYHELIDDEVPDVLVRRLVAMPGATVTR